MKTILLKMVPGTFFAVAFLAACRNPVLPAEWEAVLPPSPAAWTAVLGEPEWRLDMGEVSPEWPSAVLAWPYWPDKGIPPGVFRPAGALCPFDADPAEAKITLSWQGGADALFFKALAAASEAAGQPGRRPECFDWQRFRTWFAESAPAALRADPWLADWNAAAAKTAASGFRTTYLKEAARAAVPLSVPACGPWVSSSPFRQGEEWREDEGIVLILKTEAEAWACPEGLWTVSQKGAVWRTF